MNKLFEAKVGQTVRCRDFPSTAYTLATIVIVIENSAPSHSKDLMLRVEDEKGNLWLRRISECTLEKDIE